MAKLSCAQYRASDLTEVKMKKVLISAATAILTVASASWAMAVGVMNEDANTYTLKIEEAGAESEVQIAPGESIENVCTACSIQLEGQDSIEADGDDLITIKNGKLLEQE